MFFIKNLIYNYLCIVYSELELWEVNALNLGHKCTLWYSETKVSGCDMHMARLPSVLGLMSLAQLAEVELEELQIFIHFYNMAGVYV